MEPEQYEVMFRREERHWWYSGMRRVAMALLRRYRPPGQQALILDAGCGTGGTSVHLREFGDVFGVDLAWAALNPAASRGLRGRLIQASIEALPFRSATFDVVTSFDVAYHQDVIDDAAAFREFHRVLMNGGLLLLRVPAHDWLRGKHDQLVHTRHRYARAEVQAKLEAADFRVEQLSWGNSLLFPAAVAKRLVEHASRKSPANAELEPDLWQPPDAINGILEELVGFEAHLTPRRVALPFGLSILAVARAI